MKRNTLWIFPLLLLAAAPSARCADGLHPPAEQTVVAEGKAAVVDGDRLAAEKAAKADALRSAIEQAIGVYVKAESRNELAALLSDTVRISSGGYAVLKRVITQGQDEGTYAFKAEFTVMKVPALQLLQKSGILREWRVMVIIPELIIQRPVPDPAVQTELIRQFVKVGLKVVDQSRYPGLGAEIADRTRGPGMAAELGRKMGADIVVTGQAFAEADNAAPKDGVVTGRARVEVHALLADTMAVVAADAAAVRATAASADAACRKALEQAARELAPRFVQDVLLIPPADPHVQVQVRGVRGISAARTIQRALARTAGVARAELASFDAGVVILDVLLGDGDIVALADAAERDTGLREAAKPRRFVVTSVSRSRIIVELQD